MPENEAHMIDGMPKQWQILLTDMPIYSPKNHSATNSQSASNSGKSTHSAEDQWFNDYQNEMGNSEFANLLQTVSFNTAASDNTSVDLFAGRSPSELEFKHNAASANMSIGMTEGQMRATERFKEHWELHKWRYQAVAARTNMPAKLIAAIHWRESSGSFGTYLHQGDPLGKPAVNHPSNIPVFHVWEDAAVHALTMKSHHQDSLNMDSDTTSVGKIGAYSELYNGLGYHYRDKHSPYVYAGSSVYDKGKYVADGKFDGNVVDKQVGVVPLMGSIQGLGPNADLEPKKLDADFVWQQFLKNGGVIKQGQNSMLVQALQERLNEMGYDVQADGDFGPGTLRAVKVFQAEYGLTVDGIVGASTGAKIDSILSGNDPQNPHHMAFWHPNKKNGVV